MSKQRVLVTGGAGFIGANLLRDLIAAGHQVHVVVRPQTDLWRITDLVPFVTLQFADMLDRDALRGVIQRCRPEVIYHLASHGVQASQKDRNAILAGNIQSTANLLAALEGHDYQRLVHAGSSAEYGIKDGPTCEDDRLDPRGDYGVAKAAATLLCQAEGFRGRPVCTVRIFTAFGPGETPPRLLPYVLDCCARGEAARLTGGMQRRDFVYVKDVVELLQLAAHHPGACGRILHAATGQTHSVREMVEAAIATTGWSMTPIFGAVPGRTDEPTNWSASIQSTTDRTGWQPRFSLKDGIRATWDWLQRNTHVRAA